MSDAERRFLAAVAGRTAPRHPELIGAAMGLSVRLVRAMLLKWTALGWWEYRLVRADFGWLTETGIEAAGVRRRAP